MPLARFTAISQAVAALTKTTLAPSEIAVLPQRRLKNGTPNGFDRCATFRRLFVPSA